MTRVIFERIDASLQNAAFMLATEVFATSSSLHTALGVDLETYRTALRPSFENMVAENLSLAALSAQGKLLGCLIATDMHATESDTQPTGPYAAISALTQKLGQIYRAHRRFGPGEVLLVDMALTHPDARGLGLYRHLREDIASIARDAGFHSVVGELSSPATQHVVMTEMGHRKIAEIAFREFAWNGTRPFSAITSPPSVILAEGTL
ncbi:MAG: hypothetical protein AAF231_04220 [Pseudomonadota bacterium]